MRSAGCGDFGMSCASAMPLIVSKAAHEASADEELNGSYGAARLPRLGGQRDVKTKTPTLAFPAT